MKIIAFTKYGSAAASTRQRVMQYAPALQAVGIEVEYRPLLSSDYVKSLSTGDSYPIKNIALAYGRRLFDLIFDAQCDIIWIYSELFPYLPGMFEVLASLKGRTIVYDMDDAFFHQYDDNPNSAIKMLLQGKLAPLMRSATVCCCGNAYLQDYASRFCADTPILPTVVDTGKYHPKLAKDNTNRPIIVGWIGSSSTWRYMRPLLGILADLCSHHDVEIHAVGAGNQAKSDQFEGLKFIDWAEKTEIAEVQAMDIGLMPLPDNPWERGKCGYKLIQYMACGLPVVASPVGVNCDIVEDGVNGFLVSTLETWNAAILKLIGDRSLRMRMGMTGRARIEKDFSLRAHAPRLIEIFRRAQLRNLR